MPQDSRREIRFNQAPAHLEHTARRVKGHYEISGPLLPDQMPEGDTLMCVHCQCHWAIRPGSGTKRGFCLRCNGPTCGKQDCETRCIPFEKAIEAMEKGK